MKLLRMDSFDKMAYFGSVTTVQSTQSPLIRSCAIALAAKQLSRSNTKTIQSINSSLRYCSLHYDDQESTDWASLAQDLYKSAISYLRLYLTQAIPKDRVTPLQSVTTTGYLDGLFSPSGISTVQTSMNQEQENVEEEQPSGPLWVELLTAASILSVYEFLDDAGQNWLRLVSLPTRSDHVN